LWRDKNWDENLWWIDAGEVLGQSHCCGSIDILVYGRGMFGTTASGFAIILALFIRTFRVKNIKNVRRYFYS